MKKVLVTAFDPFGNDKVNPTELLLSRLLPQNNNYELHKLVVPTVFGKSIKIVSNEIDRIRPDIVICLGQAGGRSCISLERVAINIDDARIPDNDGNMPIDDKVRAEGPSAYFSSLPIKACLKSLRDSSIPSEISNTAGTFVCNHLMYGVSHKLFGLKHGVSGFIHIPYIPSQVSDRPNIASMELETALRGINIIIEVCLSVSRDISYVGGEIM